ncbi:MAG: hypothetical protein LBB73_06455 [Dysgonamonadaceae bacterium]|nr:hypothetical protein [Dysgonamonadaceae bacterium]
MKIRAQFFSRFFPVSFFQHFRSNRCADADRYGAETDIKISRNDFYRHGWELSATDISAFNNIMAGRAKILLYKTVGLYRAFNYRLTECIDINYGFSEDVRPQESIRKKLPAEPENPKGRHGPAGRRICRKI